MSPRGIFAGLSSKRTNKRESFALEAIGIEDNERNLRNKVSRGKFTAGFLLQCLVALGCKSLQLSDA